MRRPAFRVTVMLFSAAAAALLLSALLVYENGQMHRELLREREKAVAAIGRGDFDGAVGPLQAYLVAVDGDDVEALYCLALATEATAADGVDGRVRAVRLLRRAVDIQPGHLPAQRALLRLSAELGFDEEVVHAAEHVRRLAPEDLTPLRPKTEALARLGRYDEAVAAVERWLAEEPQDLEAHLLALRVSHQGRLPGWQVLARAAALRQAQPRDVRYLILEGAAHRMVGRVPEAVTLLRQASHEALPSPQVALILVRELEAVELFEEARQVLDRAAVKFDDPQARAMLVERLWQAGDVEALRHQWQRRTGEDEHLVVHGVRAMALINARELSAAERVVDVLRSERSREAEAWVIYLGNVFAREFDARSMTRLCRIALARDPQNAYILQTLGEALMEEGNAPEALEAWSAAAAQCPAWAAPRLSAAKALIRLGLSYEAVQEAEAARRRAPDLLEARIALALAMEAHWRQGGRLSSEAVLALVQQIHEDHPEEVQTLPLYVSLVAAGGRREDAGELLLRALDGELPEQTLLRLAEVSREYGLGLARTCYVQSEATYGRTPAFAYSHGLYLWRLGRADEGLAGLVPPSALATGEAPVKWRLAMARFLDEVGRPEALEAWRQLAQEFPDDAGVQRLVLKTKVAQSDRALAMAAIERLKKLSGGTGMLWRIAQARLVLESEHATEQEAARAALLLGEVVRRAPALIEPRLLLARSFEALGDVGMAMEQLRAAYQREPHMQPVALELARLLLDRDEKVQALALIEGVIDNDATNVEHLQQAAVMLVRLRDWNQAAAALTRALEAGGSVSDGLVFAEEGPAGQDTTERQPPMRETAGP